MAAAAGVDASTASRVLNQGPEQRVSPETRERILAAARALDYRPNLLARGLRTARSFSLGIAVPQLENPVFPEIIFGAEQAARARGYALLIAHSDDADGDAGAYHRLAQVSRADGLLVATLEDANVLRQALSRAAVPYVVLNRQLDPDSHQITFDGRAAGRLATEHLLALGHRDIAHLSGRAAGFNGPQRLAGYRAALEAAGIAFREELVVPAGYTFEGGERAMAELLARGVRCTAVVTATVLAAAGAMKLLHARGLQIPHDLSVVGIHDAALADMLYPALTTVRLPLREMGAAATDGLIDLIERKAERFSRTLDPDGLVLRASTAPPSRAV